MSNPLKWEFPGGKIEQGESPRECLKREIFEELGMHVTVERSLRSMTHAHETFLITLYPFTCRIESGCLTLNEHRAFKWLPTDRLHSLDWADADRPVLINYLKGEWNDG